MKFLIQTKNGQITTDMGRAIVEARDLLIFMGHNPIECEFMEETTTLDRNTIPVGTIEWTESVSGLTLAPTNLSGTLCQKPFVQRSVGWYSESELAAKFVQMGKDPISVILKKKLFVKSGSRIKGFEPVITDRFSDIPRDSIYFASDVINIKSEYRAFVFRNEILDVKQYAGSWDAPLTADQIQNFKSMIQANALPHTACTVDFAINENDQVELLEVHNFISCGLYGFDNPCHVATMASRAWMEVLIP